MRKSGYLYIILSALFFATGGILIKINTWSSITINGVRCFLAFWVMFIYLKRTKHKFVLNLQVLFGALANFGMAQTFVMANKLTSAANAIVLQFTMPIYIIFFLWIFWKKKPDKISVITVCCSFIGICFFFLEKLSATGFTGNILALLSGLLYAIVFLIKKIPDSDFESSALLSFVISTVLAIPNILQETDFGYTNWISILLLGIVQMGFAYICLARGLDDVPPLAASLISMVEPIMNPILVAIFYGEVISITGFIGCIIVLGSATLYNIHLVRDNTKKAL